MGTGKEERKEMITKIRYALIKFMAGQDPIMLNWKMQTPLRDRGYFLGLSSKGLVCGNEFINKEKDGAILEPLYTVL